MEEKEIIEFLSWLPESGIEEFKNKTPEECLGVLEKVSATPDGEKVLSQLTAMWKQTKAKKENGFANYLTDLRKLPKKK